MNEARRFLRYVVPGIVFIIQTAVMLILLRPDWAREFITKAGKDGTTVLTGVIATVVASGGLGVLLSGIHHAVHWHKRVLDHRLVIQRLVNEGVLIVGSSKNTRFSVEQAWVLLTRVWHQRLQTNKLIASIEPGVEELVDLVHSLGTMRIAGFLGTVVALLVAAIFSKYEPRGLPLICFFLAGVVAWAVIWSLDANYARVARLTQGVIDGALYDGLVAEFTQDNSKPIETMSWPLSEADPVTRRSALKRTVEPNDLTDYTGP